MKNTTQLPTVENLTRVEYHGQPVLTTAQLAEFYDTSVNNLQVNFNRNVDRFVEGKHFFRLEGDELRVFKNDLTNCQIAAPQLNLLYLWTKRGAFRHAKMLNTERAWEVYELLEDNYFNPPAVKQPDSISEILAFGREYLAFEREREQNRLAFERDRLDFENRRLAFDRERLEFDRKRLEVDSKRVTLDYEQYLFDHERLAFDRERLAFERDRLDLDREAFKTANSKETKSMEKAKLFRELASASKEDNFRAELVRIALRNIPN